MGNTSSPHPKDAKEQLPDPTRLEGLIEEAITSLDEDLRQAGSSRYAKRGLPSGYRARLAILHALIQMPGKALQPRLDPHAPLGHALPEIDRVLGLAPGEGLEALEELADLGLLKRELHNHVHVCPSCRRCHLNFREICPSCDDLDIGIEPLIHHFRCAYSGLESEFMNGNDLVCPKCRKHLHQLGQDFERPHDTYICRPCGYLFEEPVLQTQCFHCCNEFPSSGALVQRVSRYRATALATRAVELNRLTELDMAEMLFDSELRLDTHEFLVMEAQREVHRLRRHNVPVSAAIIIFELGGTPYPIYRDWDTHTVARLGELLSASRFPLDLIARMSATHVGVLLPHTDAAGLKAVESRYVRRLRDMSLSTPKGQPLEPIWAGRTWASPTTTVDDVLDFLVSGGANV